MKKVLFFALALLAIPSVQAQDIPPAPPTPPTPPTAVRNPSMYTNDNPGKGLYVSFGVSGFDDFKMNDRLKAIGMPELNKAAFESTVGYNVMFEKLSFDLEVTAGYMDEKSATTRVRNINTMIKFRGHYNIMKNERFFFTGGADLSYGYNNFNINSRQRTIDLNNPDPADYTGHINLYNEQMFVGPSIAFGFLQNTGYRLRLNAGYEWAVISGKWKSEYANIANSFRENGQGHYYAKLTLML